VTGFARYQVQLMTRDNDRGRHNHNNGHLPSLRISAN
jgi:hypothetical protein